MLIFSEQGNGSVVFSEIFQEAGWITMETTGPKFANTIQLQTESKTIFTTYNVSSLFVNRVLWSLLVDPAPLLGNMNCLVVTDTFSTQGEREGEGSGCRVSGFSFWDRVHMKIRIVFLLKIGVVFTEIVQEWWTSEIWSCGKNHCSATNYKGKPWNVVWVR